MLLRDAHRLAFHHMLAIGQLQAHGLYLQPIVFLTMAKISGQCDNIGAVDHIPNTQNMLILNIGLADGLGFTHGICDLHRVSHETHDHQGEQRQSGDNNPESGLAVSENGLDPIRRNAHIDYFQK